MGPCSLHGVRRKENLGVDGLTVVLLITDGESGGSLEEEEDDKIGAKLSIHVVWKRKRSIK